MTVGRRYAAAARRGGVAAGVVAALVVLGVVGDDLVRRVGRGREGTPASTASVTPSGTTTSPQVLAPPRIVRDHLAMTPQRLAETAAYLQRHAGTRTNRLDPRLVVLHYSESDTYASVRAAFASDAPSLGELPGTCSHYVVDQDGTIHELVPPTTVCRHTVGLNHVAIGVEFVQSSHGHGSRWAVQQVLARPAQERAGVALVRWLQQRFGIADDAVIGHAMANDDKDFRDLEGWRNDHEDWQAPEVRRFRGLLRAGR